MIDRMINEEIKTEMEKCIRCGLCKETCPTFAALKIESYSPRGKILIAREENTEGKDQIVFVCTMCKGCVKKCPLEIDTFKIFQAIRSRENAAGRELLANKRMIANIRKYGNPFGKITKGKIPKELFCC